MVALAAGWCSGPLCHCWTSGPGAARAALERSGFRFRAASFHGNGDLPVASSASLRRGQLRRRCDPGALAGEPTSTQTISRCTHTAEADCSQPPLQTQSRHFRGQGACAPRLSLVLPGVVTTEDRRHRAHSLLLTATPSARFPGRTESRGTGGAAARCSGSSSSRPLAVVSAARPTSRRTRARRTTLRRFPAASTPTAHRRWNRAAIRPPFTTGGRRPLVSPARGRLSSSVDLRCRWRRAVARRTSIEPRSSLGSELCGRTCRGRRRPAAPHGRASGRSWWQARRSPAGKPGSLTRRRRS